MAKEKELELSKDKVMVAHQVFELRHEPSGSFLDVRGYVADYIRSENPHLPHWSINDNTVSFRDNAERVKVDGAVAGYRSAGYVVNNPSTRNYFVDRALSFWKILIKNEHYQVPKATRFGCRSVVFVPTTKSFEELNRLLVQNLFSETFRTLVGEKQTGSQFIVTLDEEHFHVRLAGRPLKGGEAEKIMNFEASQFDKCGILLDVDYFKTDGLDHSPIGGLLQQATKLSWDRVERIANSLGL